MAPALMENGEYSIEDKTLHGVEVEASMLGELTDVGRKVIYLTDRS